MFSNRVVVIGAGLLGSTAGLGVPRMEVDFFGAEHIQPLFSPFEPHQEDLMRRDGSCRSGRHPCTCFCIADEIPSTRTGLLTNPRESGSDLNSTLCCANTEFCIVNESTLEVQCCDLGSTCGFTCVEDSYYSAVTITFTDSGTVTTVTGGGCVARPCSSTHYLCPESLGGNCCAYGQDCASGGQCLESETAVTMSVCTSGLFNCGIDTQGARCCPTGAACTSASPSGYYCLSSISAPAAIPIATSATATTAATADPSNGNDSVALRVGLGVGIPGGIISIAVIVFAWRIRRAKKQRKQDSETNEKQGYMKPELAADSIAVPAELDTCVPELSAQILEAELPEEGTVAELGTGRNSVVNAGAVA